MLSIITLCQKVMKLLCRNNSNFQVQIWPWTFDPKSIVDFLGSWLIHHYMCEVSSLQYQKEMELSHVKTTFPPWSWPLRYDLRSRSWHTPGSWTYCPDQTGSEDLWPGQRFWVCVHCEITLEIWPWVPFLLTFYVPNLGSRTKKMTSLASKCINMPIQICTSLKR